MRRATIEELTPGMKLARTLHYDYGGTMLTAGAVLNQSMILKLRDFDFTSIYIHDEETEDALLYDYVNERERRNVTHKLEGIFNHIKTDIHEHIDPEELRETTPERLRDGAHRGIIRKIARNLNVHSTFAHHVDSIIRNILSDQEIVLCVGAIKTLNSYLYDHSLEVAIHTAIMAKRFGFSRRDIVDVTLGALLHDIGRIFIPEDIAEKAGKLDHKEMEIDKLHAAYGYYLLREREDISVLSAHVAYQHHERQDGSGFPRGLTGSNKIPSHIDASEEPGQMHRFAALVAVPNYYDMLISEQPHKKAVAPDVALESVRQAAGTMLNAEAVEMFLSYVPVYPMGTPIIILSGKYEGFRGTVVHIDPADLSRPKIRLLFDKRRKRISPSDIDTKKSKIRIKALWC